PRARDGGRGRALRVREGRLPARRCGPSPPGRPHPGRLQGRPAGVRLMPRLTFQLHGAEPGRAGPIEVRRASMALVRRRNSAGAMDLEPGEYLIPASLGDGQEETRLVPLKPRHALVVEFTLPAGPQAELRGGGFESLSTARTTVAVYAYRYGEGTTYP